MLLIDLAVCSSGLELLHLENYDVKSNSEFLFTTTKANDVI